MVENAKNQLRREHLDAPKIIKNHENEEYVNNNG